MIENKYFCGSGNAVSPQSDNKDFTVNISGDQPITISKEYGPLIFCELRITAVIDSCKWRIERERIVDTGEVDEVSWETVYEFDAQASIDFGDEEDL